MWRRKNRQSVLSRQLALARLEEALIRVEESQRGDGEPEMPGPRERTNRSQTASARDVSIPAQRSSRRAAQLMQAFFQARGHDGRDG
jgi:hypothetical protein